MKRKIIYVVITLILMIVLGVIGWLNGATYGGNAGSYTGCENINDAEYCITKSSFSYMGLPGYEGGGMAGFQLGALAGLGMGVGIYFRNRRKKSV